MSTSTNHEFVTSDVVLATFLKSKNISLIKIVPIDSYHSQFVFAPVPDALLEEWLHQVSQVDVRAAIRNYRHLVRVARIVQRENETQILQAGRDGADNA